MEGTEKKNKLEFHGSAGKLFGIMAVNILLTIVTFGIYAFWGRARSLRYLYQEAEFAGNRFMFHGTGKEFFIGFLKAVGIFMIIYLPLIAAIVSKSEIGMVIAMIIFYIGFILVMPLAIHSQLRYRMSRTSWRGIHFGYRGNLSRLYGMYIKGILLTIVTFGIYGPFFANNLNKELVGNMRFGNTKFNYTGIGGDYFPIVFIGSILTVITFGIYYFWYVRNITNYYYNHIEIHQDTTISKLQANFTAGGIFSQIFINTLLVLITFGLATPVAIIRNYRFMFQYIRLDGDFNPDKLEQTEENYKNATGDDLAGMLDMGSAGAV